MAMHVTYTVEYTQHIPRHGVYTYRWTNDGSTVQVEIAPKASIKDARHEMSFGFGPLELTRDYGSYYTVAAYMT